MGDNDPVERGFNAFERGAPLAKAGKTWEAAALFKVCN